MKILIATGIFPPDIGGPAQYAKELAEEFLRQGHKVKVLAYKFKKKLPTGIRHLFYFLRLFFSLGGIDLIIALDTFSVGLPTILAARIFGKKTILRTGGDFLWENYVQKTGNPLTIKDFYDKKPKLSLKFKLVFSLSKFVLKNSSAIVFSTKWQRDIFIKNYGLDFNKTFIIENFYGDKKNNAEPIGKNFLWAGRRIKIKNLSLLETAFSEAQKQNSSIKLNISEKISHENLMEKIKNCYAVILPSLSEISPNFILDAISFNKPFILTKETGFYEKLKEIGLFVDPLDKEDIKNKILFLTDGKNYLEYKNRISNFKFGHSWKEIASEFLDIYKKL